MNTRDNRAAAISVSLPWRGLLPSPGTLDQGDRQQAAVMYRGILAANEEPEVQASQSGVNRLARSGRIKKQHPRWSPQIGEVLHRWPQESEPESNVVTGETAPVEESVSDSLLPKEKGNGVGISAAVGSVQQPLPMLSIAQMAQEERDILDLFALIAEIQ
jgi:hypothetical protein